MNELKVINEQEVLGKHFRIYGTTDEPLFLAKDVAEWIEYDKSSINKMLQSVDEDEKVRKIVPTLGGDTRILVSYRKWLVRSANVVSKAYC